MDRNPPAMITRINGAEIVAELMALSARTAPKGRGLDSITIKIITGDDLKVLAGEMRRLKDKHASGFFVRDAANLEQSDACVLIGCKADNILGLDCGGCGFTSCKDMVEAQKRLDGQGKTYQGPNCIIKMADLGIAVGSAAKTASIHNVDNRIMYSAGVGAIFLGWMPGCKVAYGLPIKVSGKSIYFDRAA